MPNSVPKTNQLSWRDHNLLFLLAGGPGFEPGLTELESKWDDIDLKRAMWFIPTAKSGKGRYVPLASQAVELLQKLAKRDDSPYVFCGHINGKPLANVAKPWKIIKEAANLPKDFRIHDLRYTFASWGVSNGIDLYHIHALLGHASSHITQRYSHLAETGIKASVTHISNRIDQAIQDSNNEHE